MNDVATLRAVLGYSWAGIAALAAVVLWFIKKERSLVFRKLAALDTAVTSVTIEVDALKLVVHGTNGHDGVASLEHRWRNMLQPIQSQIDTNQEKLMERIEKLTIAIARANPTLRLDDLR